MKDRLLKLAVDFNPGQVKPTPPPGTANLWTWILGTIAFLALIYMVVCLVMGLIRVGAARRNGNTSWDELIEAVGTPIALGALIAAATMLISGGVALVTVS